MTKRFKFVIIITFASSGLAVDGGDILRGGGSQSKKPNRAASGAATPDSTDAARNNAKDTLTRTTRALSAMRDVQNAARNAAIRNQAEHLGKNPNNPLVNLPKVTDGLSLGGLRPSTDPRKWTGASDPTQNIAGGKTDVSIKQNAQQALLHWDQFNIGKNTTLTFDQTKGGPDVSKWIAFNHITDPSGNPTQILGKIKAAGQVYIINPNGIIFGGSSQVNARGLTASSLPINTNLINRGLLNNPDAQFLFSGLSIAGGKDGTPNFDPGPLPASGKYGDVTVQAGAVLESPAGKGGNGGRVMLVGPNVTNSGKIDTKSGQTILAAGLQVGVAEHASGDPSLRGLDVWIGAVGAGAGKATNSGIIEVKTGSAFVAGRTVNQLGAIDSTTSVSLNGRIDLKASYGAVSNPNSDSETLSGAGGPIFLNQFTGTVKIGAGSVTRILPDYKSKKSTPGTALPQRSQINIEGLTIHFDKKSTTLAPNAEVSVRAGVWPFKDVDGDRTILNGAGDIDSNINDYYTARDQRFFFKGGQIYLDDAAVISVAGSANVYVPLAQSILQVQLRGSELADSPLVRDTDLKGKILTVDIRNTGVYNGKYWVGTPLGDVTGLAGLIARNAAQLTAVGGNINLQSGGSIVASKTSILDVSGGYFNHQGGSVQTSALISGGKLVALENATPDKIYDGVITGDSTSGSLKWGVSKTYDTPLLTSSKEDKYIEGAAGGTLSLTAPSMALDGKMRGLTVQGPRQRAIPPGLSVLKINFEAEKEVITPGAINIKYIKASPTPPTIIFSNVASSATTPLFSLVDDMPVELSEERRASVVLSSELLGLKGFGSLEVMNPDGLIKVPANVTLTAKPKGVISLSAANISILGTLKTVGGKLNFNTYGLSPSLDAEYGIINTPGSVALPLPNSDRGQFTLAASGRLSTAGELVDDSPFKADLRKLRVIDGGSISINASQATLIKGSTIDVSGGAYVSEKSNVSYGKGGLISVMSGKDLTRPNVLGGSLVLDSTLSGYSGSTGGTLMLQAGRIQIGGEAKVGVLTLNEEFFSKGGFSKFNLTGIGGIANQPGSYEPAVLISAGTQITPRAMGLIAVRDSSVGSGFKLKQLVGVKGVRSPVSLNFSALGSDDLFTPDILEVRGDIFMGKGAAITTDAGASVSFKGGTVTLLGSVISPGGVITVAGARALPLVGIQLTSQTKALATVHLGSAVTLSTAGITQLIPDIFNRRVGKVYDGGSIAISGNIVAEAGSLLDVSGATGVLDLDSALRTGQLPNLFTTTGLVSRPLPFQGVATRIDSNGGTIDLTGSQMLLSDAALRGGAGGSTATGGFLSISSGRFNGFGQSYTGADVNLQVKQSGNVIALPMAKMGVGLAVTGVDGVAARNGGYFAIDRFQQGDFASLSLGGKFQADGLPKGGNLDFQGKIDIFAKGSLRLAAGGVIRANDVVKLTASSISVGQDFTAPLHPNDLFNVFQKSDGSTASPYSFSPTYGTGSLDLNASLIDVGNLSLQNIGKASLTAIDGDIRGNGTLSMAGDLVLKAAQVYPTTLGKFDIFAYDHDGVSGSITLRNGGKSDAPLSAGGSLSIYSSKIIQSGVLRAPFGIIRLGWDGTDIDPATAKLDTPVDAIAGLSATTPVASQVQLTDGSLTSVSGKDMQIPFGVSPDGLTWIDPRGVNVTLSGLPTKAVLISGENVKMAAGATVDIRGGGDLFASRWVSGNGGSIDLLGSASAEWGGTEYLPGALVNYQGATWSARVRHTNQVPGANPYWSKVEPSFAVIPSFSSKFSPYSPYNTGFNATALAGNPGYVSGNLKVGDTITLEASEGLAAGTYTLLPRAYANFKGAFLVTPVVNGSVGSLQTADGSSYVSGYLANALNPTAQPTALRSRFEIASSKVIKNRVTYSLYSANEFIGKAGGKQLLPADAGYAGFHGNAALNLSGSLLAQSLGRGATVDISSFSDIYLTDQYARNPVTAQVALDTTVLTSWNAESLLIGGVRRNGSEGTVVDVRAKNVTLDNPVGILHGPEITLVAKDQVTVAAGASLASLGKQTSVADKLLIQGDGVSLRVSSDPTAAILRSGLTGSTVPLLSIGPTASISGPSVILDSTFGTLLSPSAEIESKALTLSSGLINIVFDGVTGPVSGSSNLTLSGVALSKAQRADSLTLQSYGSIDFYGQGNFGGSSSGLITLSSSGIRGFQQGAGNVAIIAKDVFFKNPLAAIAPIAATDLSGAFKVEATTIHLGANQTAISGYADLTMNASGKVIFEGTGAIATLGNLQINAPYITGSRASNYVIRADKAIAFTGGGGVLSSGDLGATLAVQGTRISGNTDILLPSGHLTLRATDGPVEIGGRLSVAGTSRTFNDITRHSNAGTIRLESTKGDVVLKSGSDLSVAADLKGGNAGILQIITPNGEFLNSGSLRGEKGTGVLGSEGGMSGSFLLDVKSLASSGSRSLSGISTTLDNGGFFKSRDFRIHQGDVTISNINRSQDFSLAADQGNILVTGGIDAAGDVGGSISLSARGNLTIASGAKLSAAGKNFNSAGKGGSILLEAGTQVDGVANADALLDLQEGSLIDLGVTSYVPGSYRSIGSSAFSGKFTGTLHLRAPRTVANDDVQVTSIKSDITGASAILVEGFKVYTPANGVLNIAQRNLINNDAISFLGSAGSGNANEVAMRQKLLTGSNVGLDSTLVIAPGVEMLNLTGDLTLGLANRTGTTNVEALAAADWDLSSFRYGSRSAPGVLTLRAGGDIVLNNTLSDGFTPILQGAAATFADNGHSLMWLGRLMKINDTLPVNAQSWSYRLTAGADVAASNFRAVIPASDLDLVQPLKGSLIVGEFYPAVPNGSSAGGAAATGALGQTADTIRISDTNTNRGNRFEVIRTGTGEIAIHAGRDVQLRNTFSTIYTAGVAVADATTLYSPNDFVAPVLPLTISTHPDQKTDELGAIQQLYPAAWSMAGGDISIQAGRNIGRYTLVDNVLTVDSSRQMPTNWLYRRGYVDTKTGLFANDGGITNSGGSFLKNVTDVATSTTWWIDFSNFFQGVGTLGGGNIRLNAGSDVVNVDAVAPTNARMAGRSKNPEFGVVFGAPEYLNLAPDASKLLELGGGDIRVNAGRDISGGVYYLEKGQGSLFAGRSVTTNASRSSSLGILNGSAAGDSLTWLPTTLFVGKSRFEVAARDNVLLGPMTNPFLLPQGINNKFWYKTYFNTFSADAGVDVASYGGNVTHRTVGANATSIVTNSLLAAKYGGESSSDQPWLRLAEKDLGKYGDVFKLAAPNLKSTAFSGDINLVGSLTLFPSVTGNLELVAGSSIVGLNKTGRSFDSVLRRNVEVWTSSTINLSDAAPKSFPSITSPLAYQGAVGRKLIDALGSSVDILSPLNLALRENGSPSALAGSSAAKQALHGSELLHLGDQNPVRFYALGGDITGLTLFSPKQTRIMAERDITDVAFYLQNVSSSHVSLVSAGRDIVPFNENSGLRTIADDLGLGNFVGDLPSSTATKGSTKALAGDIQINGPGVLEVISGRNLNLGTGPNFASGAGVGLTSIGNIRNPNLPFGGADLIALAGVTAADGKGPANGLANSSLDFKGFITKYLPTNTKLISAYLEKLGVASRFSKLTSEQEAIVALEKFYQILRKTGLKAAKRGNYKEGEEAIVTLFGKNKPVGDILTQARDVRTTTGGAISLGSVGGSITMSSVIFGNPLTPPGIVTEYGGAISTFTDKDVSIGQARIFTLRGGNILMWSSKGNIAAGTSPKTVVTAPPTRVVIDVPSADVQTDLGGLATGGGIGVLASVDGVKPASVDLIAPKGFVDAGDAGIRATGNLNISAQQVFNSSNISVGGKTSGAVAVAPSGPSVSAVASAANTTAAAGATTTLPNKAAPQEAAALDEALSIISVDILGYGDATAEEDEEEDKER